MTMPSITEFSDLATLCLPDDSTGSLCHTKCSPYSLNSYKKNALCDIISINSARMDIHGVPAKLIERYFSEDDLQNLKAMYDVIFPNATYFTPRTHLLFSNLQVLGELFLSSKSQSQKSTAVMAYWRTSSDSSFPLKVDLVQYFFMHKVSFTCGAGNIEIVPGKMWTFLLRYCGTKITIDRFIFITLFV